MSTPITQNTVDLQEILGIINNLPEAGEGGSETTYEIYDGTCYVTPSTVEQVLPTAHKIVPQDVTVAKIPFSETTTSNTNGKTVSIG